MTTMARKVGRLEDFQEMIGLKLSVEEAERDAEMGS